MKRDIGSRKGKASDVLLSALNNLLDEFNQPMKHIKINGFNDAAKAIAALENKHPEWFPQGVKGVYSVNDKRFFAAYSEGHLWLSNYPDSVSKFKLATEIVGAFKAVTSSNSLTFKQEYAFECLWHEISHSKYQHVIDDGSKVVIVEALVQWEARNTYPELLNALNVDAAHQQLILSTGYGYQYAVANLNWLFSRLNIRPLKQIQAAISNNEYSVIHAKSIETIAKISGVKEAVIARCLNYLREERLTDYRAKVEKILSYHNSQS